MAMKQERAGQIPVTILTGFLGAGKTTLLNRILREAHGLRIAVIENEFGEAGIDNEILLQERDEQIVEMNNGCICCTVRGDLVRILGELQSRRNSGRLRFDHVVIETTGLADPAPVAQTFFVDADVARDYRLDAIITVVDAVHANAQLDEHHEAQEQAGFADRLLLSKTDLASAGAVQALSQRLRAINPRAPILPVAFGNVDIAEVLDIDGFRLDAILQVDPAFLDDVSHEHDDDIGSFAYRDARPFDLERLETFFSLMLKTYGPDLLRYKGVLHIEGKPNRVIFQGVHMLFAADEGKPWAADEPRESTMVFIGRDLPRALIEKGLALCRAGVSTDPAEALTT
jgi:G3E family GTPase